MKFFYLIYFITVCPIIFSCNKKKEVEAPIEDKFCISDSMMKMIKIDSAKYSNIADEVNLSGEVSFDDKKVTKVYPFSSGQVLQVNVSVGDRVIKGQVLATVKSADVYGNYSDLSFAGNDVAIAKKQMENEEALFKNGIASEREYIEAKLAYEKALTTTNKIKNQLLINGNGRTNSSGSYVITSPISGYVIEKKINQGAFLRSDASDNLFTIGDISDVWIWANVYEADIPKVKPGYNVLITALAYPNQKFTGTIDEVSNILDPVSKVMKVKIKLPNPQGLLKPEMFANVIVNNRGGQKVITIPSKSVISLNGKDYIILYKNNCDIKVQEIQIIKTVGNETYVSNGISDGEKLISENQILLFNALTDN